MFSGQISKIYWNSLTKTSKVWFQDAEYPRTDGATFDSTETADLKKKIKRGKSNHMK